MHTLIKDLAYAMALVRRLRGQPPAADGAIQCTRLSAMFRVAKEADVEPELVMRLIVAGQRSDFLGIAVADSTLTRIDLLHLEPSDTTKVAVGWVGPSPDDLPDVAMAATWLAAALDLNFGDFYRHDDTEIRPSDDTLGG